MNLSKKNILVLYYSQSGQLRNILESVLMNITDSVNIDYEQILPEKPYPFPWDTYQFFDTMPETVLHQPIPLLPVSAAVLAKQYDLVILGYQPWFLNPSLPVSSFLQSAAAKQILNGVPVITIIGSRNMWLHAQERVKEYLIAAGAQLVGNIAFRDTNPNLISTLTVIRWAFKGQKEASGMLPEAGVQKKDIKAATRFGDTILRHLDKGSLVSLHNELTTQGAIEILPSLIILEERGIGNFRKWANYIRQKGEAGNKARFGRVILFKRLLIVGIFILSPISSLTASIKKNLNKKSLKEKALYFQGIGFTKGMF